VTVPDDLWTMADLVTPMAIRVAATLRIADHLDRGVTTAPELAKAVAVDADALDRVLRHLVTVGVLTHDGGYALTALGERLRAGDLRDQLDIEGPLGRAELSFAHLLETVRTGEAAFPLRYGREFWDDLSADPERTASYAALMGVDATDWAPAIVAGFDWASLGHVTDVGGGNGSLLTALLRGHPTLRGTVVDLAGPVEAARVIEPLAPPEPTRPVEAKTADPKSVDPKRDPMANLVVKSTAPAPATTQNVARPPAPIPGRTETAHSPAARRIAGVQRALTEYGYGQLKPTGTIGADTQTAISKFERDRKLPVTGQMSDRLVKELTAMIGHPID